MLFSKFHGNSLCLHVWEGYSENRGEGYIYQEGLRGERIWRYKGKGGGGGGVGRGCGRSCHNTPYPWGYELHLLKKLHFYINVNFNKDYFNFSPELRKFFQVKLNLQ